jgi:hypothetical protein
MDYDLAIDRLKAEGGHIIEQEVALEYEFALLESARAPDIHIEFACWILSQSSYLNQEGTERIILSLYDDRDKISSAQFSRFGCCVADNFQLVSSENVAFAIGDIIARVMPVATALDLFRSMVDGAICSEALSGVALGMDIVRRQPIGQSTELRDSFTTLSKSIEERWRLLEARRTG